MPNLLVTGSSGFIGQHVVAHLLEAGHEIYAPVRASSIQKVSRFVHRPQFHSIEIDFYNSHLADILAAQPIDAIIHLASIRGEGFGSPNDYQKINVEGTHALLEYALEKGVRRFLYCSTVGVLGAIPQTPDAKPDELPRPDNLYHKSKWQAEQAVRQLQSEKMKFIILRPTIAYGPGDDGFIPKLIEMVSAKRFVLNSRQVFIHLLNVQAFARLMVNILEKDFFSDKTYHVADRQPVLLNDVVNLISNLYYGEKYPRWLQVPEIIFKTAQLLLKVMRQKRLLTSIQLIAQSWTYDITSTMNDLDFEPADTLTSLETVIRERFNEIKN